MDSGFSRDVIPELKAALAARNALAPYTNMFNLFGRDKSATKEPPEGAQPAPGEAPAQEKESIFSRLKKSVTKTRTEIAARVEGFFGTREFDPEQLRQLENALLAADLGVTTTRELMEAVRSSPEPVRDATELRSVLKRQLVEVLYNVPLPNPGAGSQARPYVILVVGVNGTGKTTTIGKLAHRFRAEGLSVMLCAGDTFRAAATEQLTIWAERTGAQITKQKPGSDPTAVVYEALAAANSRGSDVVIVDTAGRLQNKSNLMAELDKMKRTANRLVPGAPHEVLLVLDATIGQNGLTQAREFFSVAGVTGIVLTKLDGTAHGGIVVPIVRELGLPVRFVGTGETADDLVPFDPKIFVDSLFD